MGDGWLWVTAHRTGEQGLVFQDLVESIDETIDPNRVFNWFHDNITKDEAVDMLVKGVHNLFAFAFISTFFKDFKFNFSWSRKLSR